MNSISTLDASRSTPWQKEVSALAASLRHRLGSVASLSSSSTLWLGGACSELLSLCGSHLAGTVLIADTRTRGLRAGKACVPDAARTLRLLALDDLRRDVAGVETMVAGKVLHDIDAWIALQEGIERHFQAHPVLADGIVDTLVMDFALNRIDEARVPVLLAESLRVTARTGRVLCVMAIADERVAVPQALRGAPPGPAMHIPTEQAVMVAFEQAGFHGMQMHWTRAENTLAVDRIGEADVRICMVEAHKGKQGPCMELGQAVMYRGPWREVRDDDGHVYRRGERVAVCAKTYDLLMREPYDGALMGLRSVGEPLLSEAAPFDCNTPALRSPRVTKGLDAFSGARGPSECVPGEGCC